MSFIIESKNSDVKKLYNKVDSNKEFELMIFDNENFSLSYNDYLICLEFISKLAKVQKFKIESINTLDIAYFNRETSTSYRITLESIDTINKYMKMLNNWKNHVTYKVLITKFLEGAEDIQIIEKVKNSENVVDITDYNIRLRLSEENQVNKKSLEKLKNLKYTDEANISFRFKERVSVYIDESKDKYIKIDLTKTHTTKNIKRIDNIAPNYELEIEYMNKSKPKNDDDLNNMLKYTEILLKVIQQSNTIISTIEKANVLKEYAKILSLDYNKLQNLNGRKPESLEIQYVTENLPNRYAVTDKADGERNFLIIVNRAVYFINTGLHVKDTGIRLDKKLDKYNGSILDGENIFLAKENRHLMMIFDCLFNGAKDVRENQNFMERIKEADDIISNCFILNKQRGYDYKEYSSKTKQFDLNDITNFHNFQIKEYMDNLNFDINHEKKYPLIRRKYFIGANGAKPWEIFQYSTIIWEKYTEDPTVKCPYLLDGLIYHPLNQKYTTNAKDNKFIEYKWKPPTKNSVDLYITFEKDPKSGKILNVYDNSVDENVRNKPYRIVNLFVGKTTNFKVGEEPVPFREEEDGSQAYLFLQNGEVRDLDGKIISDRTVVEFYYNDDAEVDPRFRWIPIKTRYDKTENVMKFRKSYGNYITVANKVWRSITNPILMTDFTDLAKGNNESKNNFAYDKKIESIRAKIGKELIISANKENAYYTVTGNLAKPWRAFHNWIKSLIIYTHSHFMYQGGKHLSVLDVGCGRGGDIMKYYYANVEFVVGIDPSKDGITNAFNGAISRYNNFRKGKPRFPRMDFIQGDGGALLNYEDQFRSLGGISNEDKKLMEKYFSKDSSKRVQFDRISAQFSIHYMFASKQSLTNFKQNINDYLKYGGYLIATCFDAEKVHALLGDTNKYSAYYTNEKGEKKLFFQIVKKYADKKEGEIFEEGNAIDFFGAWMFQEGQFETEYLVDTRFITQQFLDDCDLELIDTDTFDNQYTMQKEFVTKYAKYESVPETRKFFMQVKEFYDEGETDLHKGCIINDSITRFFIFRKKDKNNSNSNSNSNNNIKVSKEKEKNKEMSKNKGKKMKGGGDSDTDSHSSESTHSNESFDLTDANKYHMPKLEAQDHSLFRSVHEVLQTHNIVPKKETYKNLFKGLDIKLPRSNSKILFNTTALEEIGNKVVIGHEIEGANHKDVINGLSITVVEKVNDKYLVEKPTKINKANIVLFKEGGFYTPIYKLDDKFNKQGLFKRGDDFLSKLDGL